MTWVWIGPPDDDIDALTAEYEDLTGHPAYASRWAHSDGAWTFTAPDGTRERFENGSAAIEWLQGLCDGARRAGVRKRDDYGG